MVSKVAQRVPSVFSHRLNPLRMGKLIDDKKTLSLLEHACAKITKTIEIPYVDPKSQEVKTMGLFSCLDQTIIEQSPGSKAFIYGGVVRSILGYICFHLLEKNQSHPERSTHQLLEEFLDSTENVSFLNTLGVGSDLDILLDHPEQGEIQSLAQLLTSLINAYKNNLSEKRLGSFFAPHGDVLEYSSQVHRSTQQGGSPLDWLAFPMTSRSGSHIRLPSCYPNIMHDFIQGSIHFVPVKDPLNYATKARQIRPLLEIPHLQPSEESLPNLIADIQKLAADYRQKNVASVVDFVFKKAVRNARSWEVCNEYAIFDETKSPLHQAVYQLSRQRGNNPLIPEFLPSREIDTRAADFDPGNLAKDGHLISYSEFIRIYTDNGILYHGTPDFTNIGSMMRVGLVLSSEKQGRALRGRGFYTTNSKTIAKEYEQGEAGLLLSFMLSKSPKLRVLNLPDLSLDMKNKLRTEARQNNMNFHEYLSDHYAIDIIVDLYVLIQNAKAIHVPKTLKEWIDSLAPHYIERLKKTNPLESYDDFAKTFTFVNKLNVLYSLSGAKSCLPGYKEYIFSLLQNTCPISSPGTFETAWRVCFHIDQFDISIGQKPFLPTQYKKIKELYPKLENDFRVFLVEQYEEFDLEAISIALEGLTGENRERSDTSYSLLKALIKKGKIHKEASKIALLGLESSDRRDISESLSLFSVLVNQGAALEEEERFLTHKNFLYHAPTMLRECRELFSALVSQERAFDQILSFVINALNTLPPSPTTRVYGFGKENIKPDRSQLLQFCYELVRENRGVHEIAQTLVQNDFFLDDNVDWERALVFDIIDALIQENKELEIVLQAAKIDVINNHRFDIYKKLFINKIGYQEALETAMTWIQDQSEGKISKKIKGFQLMFLLVEQGYGFAEAREAVLSELLNEKWDFIQNYHFFLILSTLIKQGQAIDETLELGMNRLNKLFLSLPNPHLKRNTDLDLVFSLFYELVRNNKKVDEVSKFIGQKNINEIKEN